MYQRILVAVDGSRGASLALGQALRLAAGSGAAVGLVHVLDTHLFRTVWREDEALHEAWRQTGQRFLDDAAEASRAAGIEPERTLVETDGRISRAIVAEAGRWKADVVVLSTHGRHGLERFALGSVAEGVIRESPVPVLSVREG